jgi:hypothetical protein
MHDLTLLLAILAIVALAIYFLPTTIARKRGLATTGALFWVNLFFGWTLIGWLFCILWAATGATAAQDEFYNSQLRNQSSGPDYPGAHR